ncbi:nicotinate (nicotinamide) nucleotide adenylyltransferase [Glaciecola sp. KUL10]|uniref:nicotinate (nicotinamide) nucleotide adenylyltransferase n=1 Tax=Glaciecola sp. (strain KUL10) TaxID=2161813 RepID=UPI000D78B150|nr:nicotinate (nicotinamide) nucleotide adenylyltransferase [Glaciecola sp. KUL10]GBL03293.1 nicotinate-nucleotide adenylyltransferase [Glaciecola sp. KUL10]
MKALRFIFGGTFDPIHYGHINPLQDLAQIFEIERIFLMPNKIPAHKNIATASQQQRVDMLSLVCRENSIFNIEYFELNSSDISYTANTLARINEQHKGQKLIFIMGADSWLGIESWYKYKELVHNYHFIVIQRPLDNEQGKVTRDKSLVAVANKLALKYFWVSTEVKDQVSLAQEAWQHERCSVTFCKLALFDISSTEIRSFFKHGRDFADNLATNMSIDETPLGQARKKLPQAVFEYVLAHQIYSSNDDAIDA